jgi:hypothetical protein
MFSQKIGKNAENSTHYVGLQENRHFYWKLVKTAENSGHSIDPRI